MRRSIMEHRFSEVPKIDIQRSTFDRSHRHLTTFDSDYLIPVLVDEVLPGDTFRCDMSFLCRLATPYFPIMDNMYLDSFFFFVPYRILWYSDMEGATGNWKKFCGEKYDPADSIAFTIPQITLDTDATALHGSNGDYMGIPLIDYNTSNYTCSAIPFMALETIFNEWFRDQNLQDSSILIGHGDGPHVDTIVWASPFKRGKRHDYFTSCLPWLQKGDSVELPLGTDAPIEYYAHGDCADATGLVRDAGDDSLSGCLTLQSSAAGVFETQDSNDCFYDPNGRLYADLSAASAATVSAVRQAFQLQRFLEKDARSGSKYVEIVQSHFGIQNAGGDARFQRPEYLGGGSTPINITPIAATATAGNYTPGDLSAAGTAHDTHSFVKSFTEHGILIGLVNVRADITYQCEGFQRFWHRSTRYDFYWPVLSHIGEQAVLNREIYIDDATITAGTDDDVFGYQERYAEYRYFPSMITGVMRSNAAASLDAWHLAEEFAAEPTLDSTFIVSNASEGIDRAIQTPSEPQFIFDAYFHYICTRPMPVHSVPGLIDHF